MVMNMTAIDTLLLLREKCIQVWDKFVEFGCRMLCYMPALLCIWSNDVMTVTFFTRSTHLHDERHHSQQHMI